MGPRPGRRCGQGDQVDRHASSWTERDQVVAALPDRARHDAWPNRCALAVATSNDHRDISAVILVSLHTTCAIGSYRRTKANPLCSVVSFVRSRLASRWAVIHTTRCSTSRLGGIGPSSSGASSGMRCSVR